MRIWNGREAGLRLTGAIASIGNYDGVHAGHREILRRVVDHATRQAQPSLLISFEPHPLEIVAPDRRPKRLQTRRQRLDALDETGLEHLWLIDFDKEMAELNGEEFFSQVIDPAVGLGAVYVGENFRFGKNRDGDFELLGELGKKRGFATTAVPPVLESGAVISSSAVRKQVAAGELREAAAFLGRPYAIEGEVVEGEQLGRKLGFPTANVATENELLPADGVYVTETVALAARYPAVTNIGVRPTFGSRSRVVETHLIGFHGDLYGTRVEIRFLDRVRQEMRFDSPSELADQIARDRAAAEAYFNNPTLDRASP